MEKAKRSPFMRIAGVMLGASLLMTCVISGTLAKYTSSATGSDTATVAKWSIKVSNTEIAANNPTVAFNLFDTVKDSDATTEESDVAATKIAPGTSGKFDLKIVNESEVTAMYAIDFTVTNDSDIPLEFSTDGTNWKASIDDLDIAASDDTKLGMETNSNSATKTIYWRWAFEKTDDSSTGNTADTLLGIKAQSTDNIPTVTVSATITATQVD